MKVLLLNTTDILGGAARGAYRLHIGLKQINIGSEMLVQYKLGDDDAVIRPSHGTMGEFWSKVQPHIDKLPLRLYRKRMQAETWSLQWLPGSNLIKEIDRIKPDVIHLNWIGGFVPISAIGKLRYPIVWTLSDMWSFTGGCHYDQDCSRYCRSCGICPQLGSHRNSDLSRWIWKAKRRAYRRADMTVVAVSNWLADCAKSSSLFSDKRVEMIPYGLDTNIFKPHAKSTARELLGLPQKRKLVLFGADGGTKMPRKGFQYLRTALENLVASGWADKVDLAIFGESKPTCPPDWGFNVHYLGRLNDDVTVALAYSAADVMIVPSIQEAFGQTISEAMACGTPVVGFAATGPLDIIEHKRSGYLAQPFEADDLADGIAWVLEDQDRWQKLSSQACQKVEREYSLELQAQRYEKLYHEIAGRHGANSP